MGRTARSAALALGLIGVAAPPVAHGQVGVAQVVLVDFGTVIVGQRQSQTLELNRGIHVRGAQFTAVLVPPSLPVQVDPTQGFADSRKVSFLVTLPAGTPVGDYAGQIRVTFKEHDGDAVQNVPVKARVVPEPFSFDINPQSLDFGSTHLDARKNLTLTMRPPATPVPIELAQMPVGATYNLAIPKGLSVAVGESLLGRLTPGQSVTVSIGFATAAPGVPPPPGPFAADILVSDKTHNTSRKVHVTATILP